MASIRKRSGKWYFRGTVPARQPSGEIVKVRVERCLGTQSRTEAQKRAADLERHFWQLAHGPSKPKSVSFAQAALTYIETRQKSDRFIERLIEHFGDTPLNEITQEKAVEAASKLYPGWKASSLNRAIFTPLLAIANCSRIKLNLDRYREDHNKGIKTPDEAWFDKLYQHAPPKLAALVTFLTLTGRRIGEALALTEKDVDAEGVVHIRRTKTETSVSVRLPGLSCALLADSNYYSRPGTGQPSRRLFGYSSLQAASVALRRTCDRAGIPYYSFHKLGRHAFATRGLKAGKSIKWLQIAGGWKSHKSLDRYLHLEQSEVARDVEALGEEWSRKRKT